MKKGKSDGKLIRVSRYYEETISSNSEYILHSLANTKVPTMLWSFQAQMFKVTRRC